MSALVSDPFGVRGDPVLTSLPRALDPEEMERHLARLPRLGGPEVSMRLASICVVRYKPGRRCLIEYTALRSRGAEDVDVVRLIGKIRCHRSGVIAYRLLDDFWRAGFGADNPDRISVPEPIGVVRELGLWLQRFVPGRQATELLAEPGGAGLAERIAEAAHKVHHARVATRHRHAMTDEVAILANRLPAVAEAEPRWHRRVERVLGACARLARSVPEPAPCGIHRDFYADQVLVDGERLHLTDFDLYCAGDPALDIGNFIGHLREQGLRIHGDPEALSGVERALEDRFAELAGEPVRSVVRAYAVLTLVRHIHLSTLFAERRAFTERLLECAEETLEVSAALPGRAANGAAIHE